jgi:excisionase family DNA binding protein
VSDFQLRMDDDAVDRLAALVAERLGAAERSTPEPWVGVADAAAHLGCKPQRIYDLVHARAIPHRKDGARLLFRRSELDEWLDGRR